MPRSCLALTAAIPFFVCVPVTACGPGGSRPSPYVQPRYTSPYQTPYTTTTTTAPFASQVQKPVTPAIPTAHISVVSTDTTVGAPSTPVGRVQIASLTNEPNAKVAEVAKIEPKTDEADPSKMLAGLMPSKDEPSKIADALKGLVGPWMAVSRQGDGELSTVELLLNDNGWAKLTVPGADGKPSTSTRKIEFENNELKLTGGDADVLLGKLVEFDSRQMVLERQGGQVTFVRP